ncbi:MAG TPA: CrcB family protein [Acidimicrobiales bacterium]
MTVVALALAAALGSMARATVDSTVQRRARRPFPAGTLAVNLLGSFAAGFVVGLGAGGHLSASTRLVLASGFLGGFTTFSTWVVDSVRLPRPLAELNIVVSVAAGLGAVALGRWLALG